MIDKRLVPVNGLKKEPFSGCHQGMRYFFRCDESKETFTVFVYPEPWSFERTPDEQKESASFPVTEQGMDNAIAWLFERYEAEKEKWHTADTDCMHIVNHKSNTPRQATGHQTCSAAEQRGI